MAKKPNIVASQPPAADPTPVPAPAPVAPPPPAPVAPPPPAPVAPPPPPPPPAAPAFPQSAFPAGAAAFPPTPADVLAAGVKARLGGTAAYAPGDVLSTLANDPGGPLVEVNPAVQDANGHYAYRATERGVAVSQPAAPAFPAPAAAAPVASPVLRTRQTVVIPETAMEVETDVPLPPIRRRGREASALSDKIDGLPLNAAVFVEKTAEVADPQTVAMNACSSANKRWKDTNTGQRSRAFVVRGVNDLFPAGHPRAGQPRIGARIHRIA